MSSFERMERRGPINGTIAGKCRIWYPGSCPTLYPLLCIGAPPVAPVLFHPFFQLPTPTCVLHNPAATLLDMVDGQFYCRFAMLLKFLSFSAVLSSSMLKFDEMSRALLFLHASVYNI